MSVGGWAGERGESGGGGGRGCSMKVQKMMVARVFPCRLNFQNSANFGKSQVATEKSCNRAFLFK